MCQSKSFNASATPRDSLSFAWPTNPIFLYRPTNPTDSFSFVQSTNSTHFNTRNSPTIKARTDNRQTNIFPQDIVIDMNVEKSDDLMDVITKFEKIEIVDDMD